MAKTSSENYPPEETARRRDEVVRRMANTAPQPKSKTPNRRRKKGNKAGVGRAAHKGRVRRED